jgi:hypothetical protein
MAGIHMLDPAGAVADEDVAVAVENHDADARAMGKIFVSRHDQTGL